MAICMDDGVVSLRAMERSDVEFLYRWENDTSLWDVSDTVSPFSRKSLELFIDASQSGSMPDQIRLMIGFEGATVGCVDLFSISHVNHNASVGILVYDGSVRRRSVATRAISLLERFANESLELRSVKAEVSLDNAGAMALFRGLGYREAGVLNGWKRAGCGKFKDVMIFQHEI